MARQFGIITTSSGVSSIVIQSIQIGDSVETANAMDENGNITDINAYGKKNSVTIKGYKGDAEFVVIPETINGKPVTKIDKLAFEESTIKSVYITRNITEITQTGTNVLLHITSIKPDVMSKLSSYYKSRFRLLATESPVYSIKLSANENISGFVKELGEIL